MKKFADIKLKTKLMLGFGIVLVLALVIALIAINSLRSSSAAADAVGRNITERYAQLVLSSSDFNSVNNAMALYLSPGMQTEENRQNLEKTLAAAIKDSSAISTDLSRQKVERIRALEQSFLDDYQNNIKPLLEAAKPFDALSLYLAQMLPKATEISNLHTEVTGELMQVISADVGSLRNNTSMIVVIAFTVAAVILGLAIGYLLSSTIARQLKAQSAVAAAIAANDFSVHIENHNKDEIGMLAHAMRIMRNDLSDSIRLVIDTANTLDEQLKQVSASSDEIGSNAKSMESQAITVAAASDQMVSTTQDIARNCGSAAGLSEQSRNITNQGMDVVRSTVQDIRDQSQRTRDDAAKIKALADQTVEIGSIVSTIDDIAAQTNLLALNAAIEAARAGEAGRGFAVVADEVRALASRTTKSTQEISQMVTQIQNDANVATESMASSVENMNQVAEHAGALEQTLNDVLNHVNEVNGQITQIATAAEEQTTATSEISTNMQNISSAAQHVSHDASASAQVVAEAVKSIRALQQNLSRFKLRQGD